MTVTGFVSKVEQKPSKDGKHQNVRVYVEGLGLSVFGLAQLPEESREIRASIYVLWHKPVKAGDASWASLQLVGWSYV